MLFKIYLQDIGNFIMYKFIYIKFVLRYRIKKFLVFDKFSTKLRRKIYIYIYII